MNGRSSVSVSVGHDRVVDRERDLAARRRRRAGTGRDTTARPAASGSSGAATRGGSPKTLNATTGAPVEEVAGPAVVPVAERADHALAPTGRDVEVRPRARSRRAASGIASSHTGPPPGRSTARSRRPERRRLDRADALQMRLSSRGSTWLRPASSHQRSSSCRTSSGCSAERSWASEKSSSRWKSASGRCRSRGCPRAGRARCRAGCRRGRSSPSTRPGRSRGSRSSRSTACRAGSGAPGSANVGSRLAPASGLLVDAVDHGGHVDPGRVEHRREDVDGVAELRPHPPGPLTWPGQRASSGVRTPPSQL